MPAELIREGTFDPADFTEELRIATTNTAVGTAVWFENEHIRVWEIHLAPGERGAFHAHTCRYFWTVVEAGTGLQRFTDGTYQVLRYQVGDTRYLEHTPDEPMVHDLENAGDTVLRFVTVELLD